MPTNNRHYELVCAVCEHEIEFVPTRGQLTALKGDAQVKVVCVCGKKYYFGDPVKANDIWQARNEAIQVGAMCVRFLMDCQIGDNKWKHNV
jgi:hypothetical protein